MREAHAFLYRLTPAPDPDAYAGVVGSVDLITAEDIIPQVSFYTTKIDIPDRPWVKGFPGYPDLTKWFGVCYDGGFHVPIAGDYMLVTAVDDSVAIWIDEKLVMNNNDGTITNTVVSNLVHGTGAKGTKYNPGPVAAPPIYLTAGLHSVMIEYMQAYPVTLGVQVWISPESRGGPFTSKDLMRLVGPPRGILRCPH
jgi:hypothetical protein